MAAVLGGIDALIFTAGIGENSAEVRAAACANLAFLGVRLDAAKNARLPLGGDISAVDSLVRVLVVRAQEDWAIAGLAGVSRVLVLLKPLPLRN
jgi:acetate kinase